MNSEKLKERRAGSQEGRLINSGKLKVESGKLNVHKSDKCISKSSQINILPKPDNVKDLSDFKQKTAFTLAEILVALGIIGVVAAMTILPLIKKYQDFQYKISAKKALRDVNNAYRMMSVNDDEFAQITCPETGVCYDDNFGNNFKLLAKQFNATKTCYSKNVKSCFECNNGQAQSPAGTAPNYYGCADTSNYSFIDSSGRAWAMFYNRQEKFFVDINGFKGPNHLGKDRWAFLLPTPKNQKTNKSFIIPQYDYDVKYKDRMCPSGDCKYYSVFYK